MVKDLDNNLAAVRVNLTASMDSYLSTLKLKLRKAREVESQTLDRIESVPQQEKKALGIIRQQSIKESLYTFLLNKREGHYRGQYTGDRVTLRFVGARRPGSQNVIDGSLYRGTHYTVGDTAFAIIVEHRCEGA